MTKYILKRFGLLLLTIFAITFIVYLIQVIFGVQPFTSARLEPPRGESLVDFINRLRLENGLLDNPVERYFKWMGGVFTGNFGKVYQGTIKIPQDLFLPLRWTLLISFPTFVLSTLIGIFFGTLAAYNRGKAVDSILTSITTFFSSIPAIVIAPLGLIFFYRAFGLPLEFQVPDPNRGISFGVTILSLITPIFVLTITSLSGYTVLVRNQLVQVLTSNHVLIAKSKGLSTTRIFFNHVLRNASLPLFATIIPSFIGLLSGTIILERFFGVPGSAGIAISAVTNGEINVIMFNLLFFSGLSLLVSIFVDVMFAVLNPLIKLGAPPNSYSWKARITNTFNRKIQLFNLNKIKKNFIPKKRK